MKDRQHEFGNLIEGFCQWTLIAPQMQANVVDPGHAHGLQFSDQPLATNSSTKTMTAQWRMRIFQ